MTRVQFSDDTGEVTRYADFATSLIPPRNVDVWCPPSYDAEAATRYPVIYMHDGQNLFDPRLVHINVDWGIDEAMLRLIERTGHAGAIVVGIWNGAARWREYMPQKPFHAGRVELPPTALSKQLGGPPYSDRYLQFIVQELKPFIDQTYRTMPDREHTSIMGSSMGGLISLYALCEYPDLFGSAGCVSTHWPAGGNPLVEYFGEAIPRAGTHRLYFDYGTATLDEGYEPFQLLMDEHMRAAGYTEGRDWLTRKFEGAEHSERSWRERVELPLAFLLGLPV